MCTNRGVVIAFMIMSDVGRWTGKGKGKGKGSSLENMSRRRLITDQHHLYYTYLIANLAY